MASVIADNKSTQDQSSSLFGYKLADELLEELKKTSNAKQLEEMVNLRDRLKRLLKDAYKNNQAEIYAYFIKQLVGFCQFAAETQNHDKIAIVLGLTAKQLDSIIWLLEKKQYSRIASLLVNSTQIEEFAEELPRNKNTIFPFKEQIFDVLEKHGFICRPQLENVRLFIKDIAQVLPKMIALGDKSLMTKTFKDCALNHSAYIDIDSLEYLYLKNQPELFVQWLFSVFLPISNSLARCYKSALDVKQSQENKKAQANENNLKHKQDLDAKILGDLKGNIDTLSKALVEMNLIRLEILESNDDQLMFELLKPENIRLVLYLSIIGLVGSCARKNNSPEKTLKEFTDQCLAQAALLLGKQSLLLSSKEAFENLVFALQTTPENSRQADVSAAEILLLFLEAFRNKNREHCLSTLAKFSNLFLENKRLQKACSFISLKFSERERELIHKKRYCLIMWIILDSIDVSNDLSSMLHRSEEEAIQFKRNLFNSSSALKHVELFNNLDLLLREAFVLAKHHPQAKFSLNEIQYEMGAMLKDALEYGEVNRFVSIIDKITQFAFLLKQKNLSDYLIQFLALKPHQVAPFFHALDNQDKILFSKLATDFVLKKLIKKQFFGMVASIKVCYVSKEKRQFERKKLEKKYIDFQKNTYAFLGIKNPAENLSNILPQTKSNRISQSGIDWQKEGKTLTELFIRAQLSDNKKYNKHMNFLEGDNQKFCDELPSIRTLLTEILKNEGLNKLSSALCYYANNAKGYHEYNRHNLHQSRVLYIAKLLEKAQDPAFSDLLPALDFELIDLLDLNFYASLYSLRAPEKRREIAAFKSQALDRLSHGKGLSFPDQKRLDELDKLFHENARPGDPFSTTLLFSHIKYFMLKTHLGGQAGRMASRKLSDLIFKMINIIQRTFETGDLKKTRELVSADAADFISTLSLFKPEHKGLFSWLILNNSKFFYLFANENGITIPDLHRIKSLVYSQLADKLELQNGELLMMPEELKLNLEKEFAKFNTEKLQLLIEQGFALLMDNLQAENPQEFFKIILMLRPYLEQLPKAPSVVKTIFNLETEEVSELTVLIDEKEPNLITFFLIQLAIRKIHKLQSVDEVQCQESLVSFLKPLQNPLGSSLLRTATQAMNDSQVILDDYASKKRLVNNTLIQRLLLEDLYFLKNAAHLKDAKLFAEKIKTMVDFAIRAYQSKQLTFLFELLKLDSEETYAEQGLSSVPCVPKLHAETILQCLYADDRNGLTQLFVDHFLEQTSSPSFSRYEAGRFYFVNPDFKQAIYDVLGIIPLKLYNPGLIDVEKEKTFLATSLRSLANRGVQFKQYAEILQWFGKRKPIINALIEPSATDSDNYKALYQTLKKIWIEHLVAHRFGIRDQQLEGSYAVTMAEELQDSFKNYIQTPIYAKVLEEVKKIAFSHLSNEAWKKIVDSLSQNIAAILLQNDDKKLKDCLQKSSEASGHKTISIPVSLGSEIDAQDHWGHMTGAVFFNLGKDEYCLLSDRGGVIQEGYKNSGISLYKITKPENIASATQSLHKSNRTRFTLQQYKETIDSLALTKIYHFKKKLQKSGNCGWSSSAKMLLHSIALANFLRNVPKVDAKSLNEAINLIEKAALVYYKGFSNNDRPSCLQNYLEDCNKAKREVHLAMLAQIYLKSEHRKQRKDIIDILTPLKLKAETLKAAQETLLESMTRLILGYAGMEGCLNIDSHFVSEKAQVVLNAYLKHQDEKIIEDLVAAAVKALHDRYPAHVSVQLPLAQGSVQASAQGSATKKLTDEKTVKDNIETTVATPPPDSGATSTTPAAPATTATSMTTSTTTTAADANPSPRPPAAMSLLFNQPFALSSLQNLQMVLEVNQEQDRKTQVTNTVK